MPEDGRLQEARSSARVSELRRMRNDRTGWISVGPLSGDNAEKRTPPIRPITNRSEHGGSHDRVRQWPPQYTLLLNRN